MMTILLAFVFAAAVATAGAIVIKRRFGLDLVGITGSIAW
jgi:hypothetical protein